MGLSRLSLTAGNALQSAPNLSTTPNPLSRIAMTFPATNCAPKTLFFTFLSSS